MSKINWSSGYVTYGIPTLAFIGILYTTRVARSADLRKERQETYFEFSKKMISGWRIFEDNSPKDSQRILNKVKTDFDAWLTSVDQNLSKFQLSSPNYVSYLGDKYYEATVLFYHIQVLEEVCVRKINQKSYDKIYERFHDAAKFDLRHSIWSYLMSISFLIVSLIFLLFSITWKLTQWLWSRQIVRWIRSRKLAQWLWSRQIVRWIRSRKLAQWLWNRHRESVERAESDF